jgi:hypothetical protein
MLSTPMIFTLFPIMTNLATGSSGSDKNPIITDWITAISTSISVFVAVLIAGYSFYLTRRNEQKQTMLQVFQLLNDNGHRNARRRICNLYQESCPSRREKILRIMGVKTEELSRADAIHTESMEIVKADFDQIGSLVDTKAISKEEFLKIYWHDLLTCWKVLYDDITRIRGTGNKDYMMNFESLKSHAEKFKDTSVEKMA